MCNKYINIIAASSFSVYLLHQNLYLVNCYKNTITDINWNNLYSNFFCIMGTIVGWFLAAILIDQLRLVLWNMACRIPDKIRRFYTNMEEKAKF